jgi:hypothetical protein
VGQCRLEVLTNHESVNVGRHTLFSALKTNSTGEESELKGFTRHSSKVQMEDFAECLCLTRPQVNGIVFNVGIEQRFDIHGVEA